MRMPFNGAQTQQKQEPDSRQTDRKDQQRAMADQAMAIQHARSMRRAEPKIPARDAVISEMRRLEKEIEQFQTKRQEIDWQAWQIDQAMLKTDSVAELGDLAAQKNKLTIEWQAVEGEIKKRESEVVYKNTIARDLLDAFDNLQYTRKRLVTALGSSSADERQTIEQQLAKVFERLKRFDDALKPGYCLAVSTTIYGER